MDTQNLFPDISDHGEACHAAVFRLLDGWPLTNEGYRSESDEGLVIYLDGPDLAEQFTLRGGRQRHADQAGACYYTPATASA
jgi:hypothetical protein